MIRRTLFASLLLLTACHRSAPVPVAHPELVALRRDVIALDQAVSAGISKSQAFRRADAFTSALQQLNADYRLHGHTLNTNGFAQSGLLLVMLSAQESGRKAACYLNSTGPWEEFDTSYRYLRQLTADQRLLDALEQEERGIVVSWTNYNSFFTRTR